MSTNYTVLDVSNYITIHDYSSVSNEIDGVLIRAAYRGYGNYGTIIKDDMFEKHYAGFYRKVPIGVYFFTQATTENEAIEEAVYLYNIIRNKDIKFPIYLYTDYSSSPTKTGRADNLENSTRTHLNKVFCEKMIELGYRAGIMSSDEFISNNLDMSLLSDYSIIDIDFDATPTYSGYDAWEYTHSELIKGCDSPVTLCRFVKDVAGWESDEIKDISNFNIELEYYETEYDRSPKLPEVTIEDLVILRDYIISYEDNIDAGTGHVKILGINRYKGEVIKDFTIARSHISKYQAYPVPNSLIYSGLECTPQVIVDGLLYGSDYTVTYEDNINAGTGKAILHGIINYIGTAEVEFSILPKDINLMSGNIDSPRYVYTGEPITPEIVIDGLVEGIDYTKSYLNNVDEGLGTVVATGIGNYTGTKLFYFSIIVNDLTKADIELEYETCYYTGSPITPNVYINNFVENIDYKLEYFNNTNAGTATVRITGIGECVGIVRKTYTIKKPLIDNMEVIFDKETYPYIGKEVVPKITIANLTEGKDYKVTLTNNIYPGIATIKISAIKNYTGGITKEFEITYVNIEDCLAKWGQASIKTIYRVGLDGPFELFSDNVQLTEGKDYTVNSITKVEYEEFVLVTVIAEGMGSVFGTYTYRFRAVATEPSQPIDYEDDGVYNFGDIERMDETAEGNYEFGTLEGPDPEPSILPDETDIDFDAIAGGMRIAEYDDNNGKDVNAKGQSILDDRPVKDNPDDGTYNFGDIDIGDESANGDYDFEDIDEGVDDDSVATPNGDYDFNELCLEEDEKEREDYRFAPGMEYSLKDVAFYESHCINTAFDIRSGNYLIYKSAIANNRIRVTRSNYAIDNPVRSDGWVDVDDILAIIEMSVGNKVRVSGDIYQFASGKGWRIDKNDAVMYVTKKLDYSYPCRYGLSTSKDSPIIGYASEEQLTKIQ